MIVCDRHQEIGEWVCARAGGEYTNGKCIGLEKDGRLVAGVIFDDFNGASIRMHVAAEGKHWLNREYLWFCFYYPFEQLKVKTIIGLVAEDNSLARRFDEHLGFRLHTVIPDAHPKGGICVYVMRKPDCRWLDKGKLYGQSIRSPDS